MSNKFKLISTHWDQLTSARGQSLMSYFGCLSNSSFDQIYKCYLHWIYLSLIKKHYKLKYFDLRIALNYSYSLLVRNYDPLFWLVNASNRLGGRITIYTTQQLNYSRENITWVKTLGVHISHKKACDSINLGAKLKPLISTFRNCPWMLNLTQYWLSYGLEKVQNLNLENAQNESVL